MLKPKLSEGGAWGRARTSERKVRKKNIRGNIEQLGNGLGKKQRQYPDEEGSDKGNGTLAACERNTGQHEGRAKDDRGKRQPGPAGEVWLYSQRRIERSGENQKALRTGVEAIHQQRGKQPGASE